MLSSLVALSYCDASTVEQLSCTPELRAGDGCRSAQTSQVLEGVLAALGQLHCDATAGDLSGGGQSVAGERQAGTGLGLQW